MSLLARACAWLAARLPARHITDLQGKPYLSRYTLYDRKGAGKIYLHHFHQSDQDRELHNHPWDESVSLILTGGYYETRAIKEPDGSYITVTTWKGPFSLNRIYADTFHRATLQDEKQGAWTLFFAGRFTQRWGFLNPRTGEYTDYKEYLVARGQSFVENDH